MYSGPLRRRGTFRPKRMDTLRPEVSGLIGRTLLWTFAGVSEADETYPGQSRWMPDRSHDDELGSAAAYWAPEEDIEFTD